MRAVRDRVRPKTTDSSVSDPGIYFTESGSEAVCKALAFKWIKIVQLHLDNET
jgi:hypothetical protein